ncbi:uncharacterized protein LOC111358811 [Spodoptera litura]|uniref:Uncharacterized protein LOC111358811 n=1 Tax=Spodoptera litura TaxID=69820 RepID=A0A9J7EKC0_SPOLT|nr:uncharacterized protein LOC111358811 [Spodoptera litura]
MLFLMVVIFSNIAYVSNKNAGTALFTTGRPRASCWTEDDIAKLRARKHFEQLIPPQLSPDRVDSQYIKRLLKYFRTALHTVQNEGDFKTATILKEALSDTIGAHLKSEILPTVRFSYYAGYIPYKHAREIHDFYDNIKVKMNTQGLGWKRPERVPQWSNLTVAKILIGSGKLLDPCSCLVTRRDSNNCIHLPAPKLDDDNQPSAIALPFRSDGLVSLTSPGSENILLKYYTTASRCILHSSPANCRHSDFVNLNSELWHWMKRDVAPHLMDEKLYAAYGGVLRIAAAVQNYGKGLSRRNLFEYQDAGVTHWNPWKTLTQSYIYVNADWTPKLYISLVFLTALTICLLQILYNYLFGEPNACGCKGKSKKCFSRDIAYTNVDSNFPSVLPRQSAIYFSENKRMKRVSSRSKSSSVGSMRTQKVYDLNENTENLMAVIISDNEETEEPRSSPSKVESEEERREDKRMAIADVTKNTGDRPKSPPKLETSVAQLTIEKTSATDKKSSAPMYSTSTLTRSDVTYCPEKLLSDTGWSATSSSTSGKTFSSTSSKSRSARSRSSRDLAWARHVISRHSRRDMMQSATGTEMDGNSFTAPPPRR